MDDGREIGEFRTSVFGGFDRRDVIEYIKYSSREHNQCVDENLKLRDELEAGDGKCRALQEENSALKQRAEAAEKENRELRERLAALENGMREREKELARLRAETGKPREPARQRPAVQTAGTKKTRRSFWGI